MWGPVEGTLERYLSVFLPFLATIVLAHLVVRSSGSLQLERMGLASTGLLRRLLLATGGAMAIIVGVDALTGGDLFLTPSPRSLLLIGAVLVTLVAARAGARAAAPVIRSLRRRLAS
jgi:hypothetical protein